MLVWRTLVEEKEGKEVLLTSRIHEEEDKRQQLGEIRRTVIKKK